ncbi:MAG: hypothetical protein AB8H79_07785 [Myxococcota bacterium]
MPALNDLDADELDAAAALAGRLKHDLGKYVAFGARWLDDAATAEQRKSALRDDLLQTRRGPDGTHDALAVWAPYRDALCDELGLAEEPLVQTLVHAMQSLASVIDDLRRDALPADRVDPSLALARQVSDACRDLHRRVRALENDRG